jgi:hypothetical protein
MSSLECFDWYDFDLRVGWKTEFFGDVRNVINEAIKYAKKKKGYSREDIAIMMSEMTGWRITENTLNKWTRKDKDGHRFPYDYASYLAVITGDPRILMFMAESAGLKVLTPGQMTGMEISREKEEQLLIEIKEIKRMLDTQSLWQKIKSIFK